MKRKHHKNGRDAYSSIDLENTYLEGDDRTINFRDPDVGNNFQQTERSPVKSKRCMTAMKGFRFIRMSKEISESESDDENLSDFVYKDSDSYTAEISELYSYSEISIFENHLMSYLDVLHRWKVNHEWQQISQDQKHSIVLSLVNQLEMSNSNHRFEALSTILYLVQGCWYEVKSENAQQTLTRNNVSLLLKCGGFQALVEQLNLETGTEIVHTPHDSKAIQTILNILYTVVETIRSVEDKEFDDLKNSLKTEISQPIGGQPLAIKLINMVVEYAGEESAPHYPIKKILLLLWKVILLSLGGLNEITELKNKKRQAAGLQPLTESFCTSFIVRKDRSMSSVDLDDFVSADDEWENSAECSERGDESSLNHLGVEKEINEVSNESFIIENTDGNQQFADSKSSLHPQHHMKKYVCVRKPKVKQRDLALFLSKARKKYFGFQLTNDYNTVFGFPERIQESVKVLKQHLYVSLSEWQLLQDNQLCSNLETSTEDLNDSVEEVENLYTEIMTQLSQCSISFMKVILLTTPGSQGRSGPLNIMSEILTDKTCMDITDSLILEIDKSRHKDIMSKSISAILILLLKHIKINHIYQFEFLCQNLVAADCIPILLKRFCNYTASAWVTDDCNIPQLNFPSCVIGGICKQLTVSDIQTRERGTYSWRNAFSCVNFFRILNKLTKGKEPRIKQLVDSDSYTVLKNSLRLKNPMLQLYILKLLKMQTKYIVKKYRKEYMKVITAVYKNVRINLLEDWISVSDPEASSSSVNDHSATQAELENSILRFHTRRYKQCTKILPFPPDLDSSVDESIHNNIDMEDSFENTYQFWLQNEVFDNPIDWDELLKHM